VLRNNVLKMFYELLKKTAAISDSPGKVEDIWGKFAKSRDKNKELSWTDSTYVSKYYINKTISGKPDVNWLIDFKNSFIKDELDRGLNLGCGDGCLERHAIKLKICRNFDSLDISPEALRVAKERTEKEGIMGVNYLVCDTKDLKLKRDKYDVVFAAMSLHHFSNLEEVFDKVKMALKKDSFFIFNEYIGPSQFQWTGKQLEIMNNLLKILPESLRKDHFKFKTIKETVRKMTIDEMTQMDPSEAIRSEEIMPLVEERFKIIERKDYGGTILFWLLHGLIPNFNITDPKDKAIMDLLIYTEKKLIEEKILPSDFTYVVAKNNK